MKISKPTINVLSNFSTIGKGIVFKPGNVIGTISQHSDCLGLARVPESFPVKAPIYDLGRLLSVISIFEDPDIEFGETSLVVSSGRSKIRYNYAGEHMVIQPPAKVAFENHAPLDVTFTLTDQMRKTLLDALSALRVKDITFAGKDGKLFVRAYDTEQKKGPLDMFESEIGESPTDFSLKFSLELFNVLPGDYEGGIALSGNAFLLLERTDLQYRIACAVED